jgi:hypothetical protein
MSLSQRILKRLKTDFFKRLYLRNVSCVLETPPLQPGNLPFIVLSMVHQRDVIAYLVAIKSFARFANPERVIVICDPTIGDHEKSIFKSHIPHIELRNAEDFRIKGIPCGGTWERLSAITEYSSENYIIQLDSDTITTDSVIEVLNAITYKNSFTISEKQGQAILTLKQTSENASKSNSKHIQAASEKIMSSVGLGDKFYVRGCSGFTGFAKGTALRDEMLNFSELMYKCLGNRWSEWGTEQVTSNYLVANSAGIFLLPYPKYSTPFEKLHNAAFIHFIGEVRFINRLYEETSRRAIQQLQLDSTN